MDSRYIKNIGSYISEEDQQNLLTKTIGVLGCGGNGGFVIEYLARLGVKKIILFDGDDFENSNLNRQLYCTQEGIGYNKAEAAKYRIQEVNSAIEVDCYPYYFSQDIKILSECDLVFAELDYYGDPLNCRNTLRQYLLYKPYAAIVGGGLHMKGCQCAIYTKDNLNMFDLKTQMMLDPRIDNKTSPSMPAYACAIAAGMDVALAVRYLCNKSININETYMFDLEHFQIVRRDN